MVIISLLICAAVGSVASFVAGLFGAGASLIILPFLMVYFSPIHQNLPYAIHTAAGTTLASICVIGLVGALKHFRERNYDRRLLFLVAPAYCIGALGGAYIAHLLPGYIMQKYIGVMLVLAGLMMMMVRGKAALVEISGAEIFLVGVGISIACSTAAIASGLLLIPYFILRAKHEPHTAKGTSMIVGTLFAVVASIGYAINGLQVVGFQKLSFGYIYLPVVIVFSITGLIFTPLGVTLSRKAPQQILKPIYMLYLLIVGIYFIL